MFRRPFFLAAALLAASTGSQVFAQADSLSDAFAGLTRAESVTVQEHLQIGGFYSGPLDGAYGPGTRQGLVSAATYITENFQSSPVGDLSTFDAAQDFVEAIASGEMSAFLYGEGEEADLGLNPNLGTTP
jgi:hypothetical protein